MSAIATVKALPIKAVTRPVDTKIFSPSTWGDVREFSPGRTGLTAATATAVTIAATPQGRRAVRGLFRAVKAQFAAPRKVAALEAAAEVAAQQRAELEARANALSSDIGDNTDRIGALLTIAESVESRLNAISENEEKVDNHISDIDARLEVLGVTSAAKLVNAKLDEAERLSFEDCLANGFDETSAREAAAKERQLLARKVRKANVTVMTKAL